MGKMDLFGNSDKKNSGEAPKIIGEVWSVPNTDGTSTNISISADDLPEKELWRLSAGAGTGDSVLLKLYTSLKEDSDFESNMVDIEYHVQRRYSDLIKEIPLKTLESLVFEGGLSRWSRILNIPKEAFEELEQLLARKIHSLRKESRKSTGSSNLKIVDARSNRSSSNSLLSEEKHRGLEDFFTLLNTVVQNFNKDFRRPLEIVFKDFYPMFLEMPSNLLNEIHKDILTSTKYKTSLLVDNTEKFYAFYQGLEDLAYAAYTAIKYKETKHINSVKDSLNTKILQTFPEVSEIIDNDTRWSSILGFDKDRLASIYIILKQDLDLLETNLSILLTNMGYSEGVIRKEYLGNKDGIYDLLYNVGKYPFPDDIAKPISPKHIKDLSSRTSFVDFGWVTDDIVSSSGRVMILKEDTNHRMYPLAIFVMEYKMTQKLLDMFVKPAIDKLNNNK